MEPLNFNLISYFIVNMEYVQDLEICNSTVIVSGLFVMTLLYNCLSKNANKTRSLEIEMTDTDQSVIPVENVETQTAKNNVFFVEYLSDSGTNKIAPNTYPKK